MKLIYLPGIMGSKFMALTNIELETLELKYLEKINSLLVGHQEKMIKNLESMNKILEYWEDKPHDDGYDSGAERVIYSILQTGSDLGDPNSCPAASTRNKDFRASPLRPILSPPLRSAMGFECQSAREESGRDFRMIDATGARSVSDFWSKIPWVQVVDVVPLNSSSSPFPPPLRYSAYSAARFLIRSEISRAIASPLSSWAGVRSRLMASRSSWASSSPDFAAMLYQA